MGKCTKTRDEVSRFLGRMKNIIKYDDSKIFVVPRQENDNFRMEEGLRTNRHIMKYLCQLETENYMYNDDEPKYFVFAIPHTTVSGQNIYVFIRIQIQEKKGMVICLSLHPAKFNPEPCLIYKD